MADKKCVLVLAVLAAMPLCLQFSAVARGDDSASSCVTLSIDGGCLSMDTGSMTIGSGTIAMTGLIKHSDYAGTTSVIDCVDPSDYSCSSSLTMEVTSQISTNCSNIIVKGTVGLTKLGMGTPVFSNDSDIGTITISGSNINNAFNTGVLTLDTGIAANTINTTKTLLSVNTTNTSISASSVTISAGTLTFAGSNASSGSTVYTGALLLDKSSLTLTGSLAVNPCTLSQGILTIGSGTTLTLSPLAGSLLNNGSQLTSVSQQSIPEPSVFVLLAAAGLALIFKVISSGGISTRFGRYLH
jgi:hypothetical protein